MIVAVDNDQRIIVFNPAAEKHFGYSRDEVLGKSVDILYADIAEATLVYRSVVDTGTFSAEATGKRKNGETFTSYLSASAVTDADGRVLGTMAIFRDITEQKRAEIALHESERQFQEFMDWLPIGIYELDTRGVATFANRNALESLGFDTIEELNTSRILTPEGRERRIANLRRRMKGEAIGLQELFLKRKDGTRFRVISDTASIMEGDREGQMPWTYGF